MPGEGELAAVFARRMEGGPLLPPTAPPPAKPTNELAALFARRNEGGPLLPPTAALPPPPKSELTATLERRAAGGSIPATYPAPAQAGGNASGSIPPPDTPSRRTLSSAPQQAARNAPGRMFPVTSPGATPTRTTLSTPPMSPVASAPPPKSAPPTAVVEPVRIASTVDNEELKAKFEERNLEVGIPTPALLVNLRNNLKKAGSTTAAKSVQSSPSLAFFQHDEKSPPLPAHPLVKRNSFPKADETGIEEMSHKNENCRSSSSPVINVTAKDKAVPQASNQLPSSDVDIPLDEKAASVTADDTKNIGVDRDRSNSDSQHSINARRRRMVASRSNALSAASSTCSSDLITSPMATSARDRLIAKVRASQSSTACDSKSFPKQSKQNDGVDQPADLLIVSPKRDEFEVLFADHDFVTPQDDSTKSWDSISKEINVLNDALNKANITGISPGASTVTLPTNNAQPRVDVTSMSKSVVQSATGSGKINITPEKSRIQNASTPKIRGNGSHRREIYDEKEASGPKKLQGFQEKRLSQHHHSMPSFQEQRDMESGVNLTGDQQSIPPIPPNLAPYHFRQSPSQMSQMSGITTPSCFPQESLFFAPSSAPSNLQQPVLFGSPIPESYSAHSSVVDSGINNMGSGIAGGTGAGLSAFSSGMEVENRRLRELLGSMTQKLEEKDAIVSQLMKRIGDLEAMISSSARSAHVNRTFSTDQSPRLSHTALSVSSDLLSPGARSAGSEPSLYHRSSQQPPDNVAQASPEQLANHRPRSSANKKTTPSSSIAATSSTASVSTAISSESGTPTRSNIRPKAASGASRRSSHRRGGSATSRMSDERKFVC